MDEHSFFFDLMIILVAARLLAAMAVKLGTPAVIGELLAGVALGPSLLGWIEPHDVLRLLADVGVTLLLFEVGLETDAARLVRTGAKSIIVALAGFVLPFAFGFGLTYWLFDLSFLVALLVGGTLTATSIGITARVLSDLGRQQSSEGQIVIGAAVLDDVLGVLLLVLLHQFATAGNFDWTSVAKVSAFLIAFFLLAPFVAHPVAWCIKRLEELGRVPGLIPTVVVALVFFFAWTAGLIGAPGVLGGFAAGLALSRRFFLPFGLILKVDQGFAHRVEAQMKPIIHLFTPIFFVVVGLSLDLGVVEWGESFVWIFSVSLFAVALLGKIAGAWLIQEPSSARLMIGAAMIPRGEVGLIFAELGRSAGVFADDIYAGLIVVIALTTLLPPFFMKWLYTTSREDVPPRTSPQSPDIDAAELRREGS